MKKNSFRLILIIVGLAFIAGVYWFSVPIQKRIRQEIDTRNALSSSKKPQTISVKIIADSGEKTIISDYKIGMTAYDALKAGLMKENIPIEVKQYENGIFIESIGGVKNGDSNRYWLYYVNGQMPMVSADKEEVKAADVIEFKFEKSSF